MNPLRGPDGAQPTGTARILFAARRGPRNRLALRGWVTPGGGDTLGGWPAGIQRDADRMRSDPFEFPPLTEGVDATQRGLDRSCGLFALPPVVGEDQPDALGQIRPRSQLLAAQATGALLSLSPRVIVEPPAGEVSVEDDAITRRRFGEDVARRAPPVVLDRERVVSARPVKA